MKRNHDPAGLRGSAFNRKAAAAALVTLSILLLLAALGLVYAVSAAGPNSIGHILPTTAAPEDPVLPEPEDPAAELAALRDALAAAEAERDSLRAQLSEANASSDRLREELDALRRESAVCYVLRFRVERSIRFPDTCEVLSFTRTVDADTYALWAPGDVITDHISFLTLPSDGIFHHWTVILEDKYTTAASPL